MIHQSPAGDAAPRSQPVPATANHGRAAALQLALLAALLGAILLHAVRHPAPTALLPRRVLDWRIDVQREDAATLMLLPGVGAALAQRIVEYRREHPMDSLEALANVRGIGPRSVWRLAPYVTITNATPAPASAGATTEDTPHARRGKPRR